MAAPAITLSASLKAQDGTPIAGFLRITLCGFGPVVPHVSDGMLADAGVPQVVGPQTAAGPLTQLIYGNDVITPNTTFYEVAILDENRNVVQSGNYLFTGAGTRNLYNSTQIVPPYGFFAGALRYLACSGAVPGTVYTAPGPPVAVTYNGILMAADEAPPLFSYTLSGNIITLNFTTQVGDRIDALCVA
jgi:hypothetical protein